MKCFPAFIPLEREKVVIIGGGKVALKKAQKLAPFLCQTTVIAKEFKESFSDAGPVTLIKKAYDPSDLDGAKLVIGATDDPEVNRKISEEARRRGIPVNIVDVPALCTFYFPAIINNGDLTIGISSGGDSPSAAVYLKHKIEKLVPKDFGEILQYLESVRPQVIAAIPDEPRRAAVFKDLFELCMENGIPAARAYLESAEDQNFLFEELKDMDEG